jgi:hypothetical protein
MDVSDLLKVILSVAGTTIAGVLAWWIGKPIADARDKRLKALQAAGQNAHVGGVAGVERIVAAKAALNDAASALQSISRGHPRLVRLYCWFVGYDCDLEEAASALIRLHNMTGDHGYNDKERQCALDAAYVFLGAHQRLPRERVDEIKGKMERDRRLSEAKF